MSTLWAEIISLSTCHLSGPRSVFYIKITFPEDNMPDLVELSDCAIEEIVKDNFGDSVNPVYAFKDEVNVVEEKYVADEDEAGDEDESTKPTGILTCGPNSSKKNIADI